ncbi:hypothetical protein COCSUDRAFT_40278 [Coccomyxa subellipsoidea C-169]|uniref:Origin recognition complex subunit 4 n=1 Tax=Coccomyxa subellipsoidea (strain C-169) TaxID=574566 RepID=I0Z660_COCSC|nr:hypothetical protein COCSUDRAFT_40278 [Coccomyxa subellipsoidea C-169]EIE26129.1 hypothetical protein COCSUDRAFT_40278 [Coccomyxa subellipsoidea C-169]|eukprot:XP_005650673.1 hypothetical protein COCSUDRAFT_40278 [Coccomyxa subellipsoidea C-169]
MNPGSPAIAGTSDRAEGQLASPEALTRLALAERSAAGPASTSGQETPALPAGLQQQAAMQAQRLLRRRLLDPQGAGMALRPELEAARAKLYKQLSTTVERPGANTSYLIIGARGTGKTLMAERTVGELCAKYNTNPDSPVVGVVRLSGLVHSADRVAFREIARQLCEAFNVSFSRAASLGDNLDFLRDMLKELRKGHKSVVFVLDEFDLFAKPVKQTVLYNLLDALQASNIQAAVVGLSARFDVMEIMEKRVKSRFSHRRDIVLELDAAGFEHPHSGVPSLLAAMLALPEEGASPEAPCTAFARGWNKSLHAALQDSALLAELRLLFDKGTAGDACRPGADCTGGGDARRARAGGAAAALPHSRRRSRAAPIPGMPLVDAVASQGILELYVLVAALRLHRRGYERVNFELLWAEYAKTAGMGHADVYSKPAAARAFQRLLDAALLVFTDARCSLSAVLHLLHFGPAPAHMLFLLPRITKMRGCHGRSERRSGLWEFSGVVARVEEPEVALALQQRGQCPPLLKNWLAKDIVHVGSYADE